MVPGPGKLKREHKAVVDTLKDRLMTMLANEIPGIHPHLHKIKVGKTK